IPRHPDHTFRSSDELSRLGIERCGFHAFRHGNATVMDQEQVPIATRQNRLGQSDARTTMGYTHAMSEDGRIFAARLGRMLTAGNAWFWTQLDLSDLGVES